MKPASKPIIEIISRAVDTILPPRCVITGDLVDRQGMIAAQAWRGLEFISDPFCEHCGFPFDFEVEDGTLCASCIAYQQPYESARAALKYNDVSRSLVLGFKHGDKTHAVRAFVPWLQKAGLEMLEEADLIVPVPLHPWRLISRRYNQAALMAYALAKETGHKVVPDALHRVRVTQTQGHLNTKERHKNVRKAFALNPKYASKVKGKTIVLIDDVYTTGATIRECTKTLLKSGAARIHILTLARVAHDGFG